MTETHVHIHLYEGEDLMATIQEVLAEVRAANTKIQSIDTLMDGMRDRILREIQKGQEAETAVNQAFDEMKANNEALDAAIAENTNGEQTPPDVANPIP